MFGTLQEIVFIVLAVIVFAVQAYALVDALRRPAAGFTAEGKLSKPIWLVILGVATALGFLGLPPMMLTSYSFLNLIAVVAAIVYLVDVRPRLLSYGTGRGRSRGPSGW
ncbi:DUF2516 family protein [Isoptericola chiayiensis]|uniref:DUF2516 family protein n=1 Tax=Isoptericola chiayiensis TaxID=579446 RepID=A0ABP8YII3_9MICO|nr:hypothetical protein [Isoptericola chiayiensis]